MSSNPVHLALPAQHTAAAVTTMGVMDAALTYYGRVPLAGGGILTCGTLRVHLPRGDTRLQPGPVVRKAGVAATVPRDSHSSVKSLRGKLQLG